MAAGLLKQMSKHMESFKPMFWKQSLQLLMAEKLGKAAWLLSGSQRRGRSLQKGPAHFRGRTLRMDLVREG